MVVLAIVLQLFPPTAVGLVCVILARNRAFRSRDISRLYLRLYQRGVSTLYLYSVFQPIKHIELITGTAGLSSERIAMFPQYRAHPLLSASAESDWDLRVVCYHLWFPLFRLLSSPAQFLVLGYSLRRSETYSFLNFVYVYYTWFLTFCQELFYALLLKV